MDKKDMPFVLGCVILLFSVVSYLTLPDAHVCTMERDGRSYSGNCTFIHNLFLSRSQDMVQYDGNPWDDHTDKSYKIGPEINLSCPEPVECEVCPEPTPCPRCSCPDCAPCTCEICPKCPTCSFELDPVQVDWLLNKCKPKDGLSCYQSGYHDACDDVREFLEVPGRPKYKSRPSPTGFIDKDVTDDLYCFQNLGERFILNRTPDQNGRKRWSWTDGQCVGSVLEVRHL